MRRFLAALVIAVPLAAHADQVIDTFESGNPNQWGWLNNGGFNGGINPVGGNRHGWIDSGEPYRSDHPNFSSLPPDGSPLRAALDSGSLHSARFDLIRVATTCFPGYDLPSAISLQLLDMHSDPGGAYISAYTTVGPDAPTRAAPWRRASFTIPSESTDTVPDGWELVAPPELNYTWQDLMHNVDAISFFVINPGDITYDACWRLGADNVVITYGNTANLTVAGATKGH